MEDSLAYYTPQLFTMILKYEGDYLCLKMPSKKAVCQTSGLCYKHIMILNDDSSIVNEFEASLTDDARVVIYDRHMFIVKVTAGL